MDDYDNAEALSAQFHDRLSTVGKQAGGGHRGGRAKRGGGFSSSSSASSASRTTDISRALSRLLRHQATNAGIPLDAQGFAPLDRVLQWGPLRTMGVTVAEVRHVVATNNKQRFALRAVDGGVDGEAGGEGNVPESGDASAYIIRANQGHSIASVASHAGLLTPIADADAAPAVVCHGTFVAFWPAIEAAGGLRSMGRNHVHCGCLDDKEARDPSTLPPDVVIPGLRRDAQVLVFLDVRRALREDPRLQWWRAENGVVLTEGDADGVLPTRFFKRVVLSRAGASLLPQDTKEQLVLWEDGNKVADLPAETLAKARVPQGKQAAARRGAVTQSNKAAEAATKVADAESSPSTPAA